MYRFPGGYFFRPGRVLLGRTSGPDFMRFRVLEVLLNSALVEKSLTSLFFLFLRDLASVLAFMCAVGGFALIVPQQFLRRRGGCVGSGQ